MSEKAWCAYAREMCEAMNKPAECAKQSAVGCRARREKNEAKESDNARTN